MTITTIMPDVIIFPKSFSKAALEALVADLRRFNVPRVHTIWDEAKVKEVIATCGALPPVLVMHVESCYEKFAKFLTASDANILGLSLYCGPHEQSYARWVTTLPFPKFFSHNLKEIRRSILWYLAGGSFNTLGDAVAPPTEEPLRNNRDAAISLADDSILEVHPLLQPHIAGLQNLAIMWHVTYFHSRLSAVASSLLESTEQRTEQTAAQVA